MTRPQSKPGLRYMPALDGLRGVAVAAVLLFHADLTWIRGGHLGVTSFFTLSGFLITSLLLVERETNGTISLGAFWARRARRLVPAALVALGLIAAVVAMLDAPPSGVVGDAIASATWMANWHFVLEAQTYADAFSAPSPFQHFWSVAVEEQFYVLFPLVALAVLGRTEPVRRGRLVLLLGVLVIASTIQVARLHDAGDAIGRAYYGTDARVAEILVGSILALILVGPSGVRTLSGTVRRATGALGLAGAAGLAATFALLDDQDPRLYDGGFLLVALCTAAVVAAATQPGSVTGRVLSMRPAVGLGKISYGVYLFHWPIFVLFAEQYTDLDPAASLAMAVAATVGLAVLSYVLVETPVRAGRMPAPAGLVGWANGAVAAIALVALASGQLVGISPSDQTPTDVDVATASLSTQPEQRPPGFSQEASPAGESAPSEGSSSQATSNNEPNEPTPAPTSEPPSSPEAFSQDPAKAEVPPPPDVPPGALRVAMIGDSIGINVGRGLEIWASERDDVSVYNLAIPACPLSRGGERRYGTGHPFTISEACAWWADPSSERHQALEEYQPDVIVVQHGINEIFDRRIPEWDEYHRPGEPQFDQWLREEYAAAVARWTESSDARVVLTNTPCADFDRYRRFREIGDADLRVQQVNVGTYEILTGVIVADLFDRICPGAQYSDEVEGVEDGRPDGFHLSDDAAAALARNWLGPIVLDAALGDETELVPDG